ncbi:MAG: carbamoyl-phosphate synthase large subunit [Actinobacteria bacterium]|nr:carbamoyl-phosphate synthase large subunit [Actinomycetota bacterium]
MAKDPKINSVLVIGSGPIVIGQACEFDYSGTQACRVLRAEGIRVVLINSNPATIMTDPEFADATYIEPITTDFIEKIIIKERPDAILATLGGQTALNAAMALHKEGVLAKHGVKLIGADVDAIARGENRELFREIVTKVGGESAKSVICHAMEQCHIAAKELNFPVVVRPSFTMGGLGSGIAHDPAELELIAGAGLRHSPTSEVLLEESIIGWKEFELEVMRDKNDNVVIVCSIENIDPMGVHTGDSITVAPALTLTDVELQRLRDLSISIIREVGVATGGCNIQFAVHPDSGRIIVIEMNPRVSRSSALASKATGFPIAKIATKLAIGYSLDEISNDITEATPASFEPTLDYIVVKVPRFAFEKFPDADSRLTTTMKSVGEAMAFGRNFTEALQKSMRSLEKKGSTFFWSEVTESRTELIDLISQPTERKLVGIQRALFAGIPMAEIQRITRFDPWFLTQIELLNHLAKECRESVEIDGDLLKRLKRHGFSDLQIAEIRGSTEAEIRKTRYRFELRPVYKTVDTCAAEFEARTPYHYSSYDDESEVAPREKPAVIILGSGPNRIGQGIEFDYSCVHACFTLSEAGFETVMVNCNPETVSTDYDTSDRLYFEPLTLEDVLEVIHAESLAGPIEGVIVQLGGQTPLGLAEALEAEGVKIIGTSPAAIELAEERGAFGQLLTRNELRAPEFGMATTADEAIAVAHRVGYPVLVRPSFVLGGRGMEIVYDDEALTSFIARATEITPDRPVLIDKFLDLAVEVDVDALFDGERLFLGGIMEHIEEAGVHSGDSACVIPPQSLSAGMQGEIEEATRKIASAVGVRGLINIQFAIHRQPGSSAGDHEKLYVLEANPRASRTVPFVSKATGVPLAKAAARIAIGMSITEMMESGFLPPCGVARGISVKEAVLPWNRFRRKSGEGVDTILGPEMKSTGEVMGIAKDFGSAFAKSQISAFGALPRTGAVFLSLADKDKSTALESARALHSLGFSIYATAGTHGFLREIGVPSVLVRKHFQSAESSNLTGESINALDLIRNGSVSLVINTPYGRDERQDGRLIRTASIIKNLPCITTIPAFRAAVEAIKSLREEEMTARPIQEWLSMKVGH